MIVERDQAAIEEQTEPKPARRGFLVGLAGVCGGAAGSAFGYIGHDRIQKLTTSPQDPLNPASRAANSATEFSIQAARIREMQARQTRETVKELKAKYESPIFGRVRVWDMIEKLGMCIDASDDTLMLTSQYLHIQQILERMAADNVTDPDLHLIALLHDLGKTMLLAHEAPENVVGFTAPIGEFPQAVGLENVIMQFGHDELIYSRLKDYVPAHIAWTVRYHSASLDVLQPYMNTQDQTWYAQYLAHFTPYDLGSKSSGHVPHVNMAKYRALIEDRFPQPILL